MPKTLNIDTSGFDDKIQKLRTLFPETGEKLIQDATAFLREKLTDEILNGPAGSVYPKSGYPSLVDRGSSGFVGVNSGNLRRSIDTEIKVIAGSLVGQVFVNAGLSPVGDYAVPVAGWSRNKYGLNYMEIAQELWGQYVLDKAGKVLARLVTNVSQGKVFRYRNPF